MIARIVDTGPAHDGVQVFQAFARKTTTTDGQPVSCADFPSTFRIGDPRLQSCFPAHQPTQQLGCQNQVAVDGSQTETLLPLTVPPDEELLLFIQGVAMSRSGTIVLWRGCAGALTLSPGERRTVTVEPHTTMGARCSSDADCERSSGLRCHVDPALPGNACAKLACSGAVDCPAGSVCLFDDATQGLCARPCASAADCEGTGVSPDSYGCEGRRGPDGCQQVCIGADWNKANACS